MSERLYQTLPQPVIESLLESGVIDQPNAVVESAEGSTMIPYFEPDEFEELLADAEEVAADAVKRLQQQFPEMYPSEPQVSEDKKKSKPTRDK